MLVRYFILNNKVQFSLPNRSLNVRRHLCSSFLKVPVVITYGVFQAWPRGSLLIVLDIYFGVRVGLGYAWISRRLEV
jgi:hypothetical protein